MNAPCEFCPWRVANHRKRTPWGFYRKANLRRLWNQIRGGGNPQSCHPTDPTHPDHVAAGARPGSTPKECAGSVILVLKEFEKMKALAGDKPIDGDTVSAYAKAHRDGLTMSGVAYWLVARYTFGGTPFVGGPKLPEVDWNMEGIGR